VVVGESGVGKKCSKNNSFAITLENTENVIYRKLQLLFPEELLTASYLV
jgi:hypothetical protein